ncbi:MAG: hypothetical protein M0D57_00510 [Sphingobacteriales bacterium JAD_PAG50586_3]|nr:MAG: hypothetical protein M0D57_00510 [Sphingobacteriales bacterium JAD_PAG50586_3]
MKQLLLFIAIIATITCTAQTKPPTLAKLVQLYTDTNTDAINNYAHQLGFTGEPFGFSEVGNTYDYHHHTFSSKDTIAKLHTSLSYTWGQHGIHIPYSLINLSYGTNSQAEFDALVAEIRTMGATTEDYGKPLPGNYYFKYKNVTVSACTNLVNVSGVKYSITIGGSY